ncbi:MAG: hypothetical protein AB7G93_09170 [Bdellovibrionales bacterium]
MLKVAAMMIAAFGVQAASALVAVGSLNNMTCEQAYSTVYYYSPVPLYVDYPALIGAQDNTVLFYNNPSCAPGDYPKAAWVQTADTPSCFVGYMCVTAAREDDRN